MSHKQVIQSDIAALAPYVITGSKSDPEQIDRYTDWFGFDTENDKDGNVTLASLIHESGASDIWDKRGGMIKWCEKAKGKPVVICHNLEYDLVNEWDEAYGYLQLNYLKGRLISARVGNVRFLDSFNHFRMSLAEIGEAIGIKKLDFDPHSREYVSTDSWICLKVMTRARDYIASIGGQIGATSGSSAVSVWRYMTSDEYCTGAVDTPWLRRGYYGGRTEIFRSYTEGNLIRNAKGQVGYHDVIGEHEGWRKWWTKDELTLRRLEKEDKVSIAREATIRGYDINSMYPYCMMAEYPEYLVKDPGLEKAKGMGEITVSVPHDLFVCPLPHRTTDGRLLYPVGVFRGVWTYDEIRFAESIGCKVLEIHSAYGCNTLLRPFDDFITTLYRKRKESTDKAEKLFLKVVMNSLYGKIASKSIVTRTVSKHTLLKDKSRRMAEVKWINHNRGLLDYRTPPPPYVNVCWGAMITANARLLLTKGMIQVPPEKLIYCDTDSIYAKETTLPESDDIGGMKLEKTAEVMSVIQPKAYKLDDFYRAKGVPRPKMKKDEHGHTTKEIEVDYAKQYLEEGHTEFMAPIRFRASLTSKRGKANQWVPHSRSMKTPYQSKKLSNGRYFPPVIGKQLELLLGVTASTNGDKKGK